MSESWALFNRSVVRRHRERAAAERDGRDFLQREVAERLVDRLDDVRRRFPLALDLGCRGGLIAGLLGGRGGVETLVQADLAPAMARLAARRPGAGPALAADEELLPFADGAFDLVLSSMSLHWVNDLPGALAQICRALKPDGLLLAAMLGGETLKELRGALAEAEIAVEGGLSPRVSPFADVRDAGALMQRAGFALPVVDTEAITVSYADAWALVADLSASGESNALAERRKGFSRRATLALAMDRYKARFAGPDGRVPATFQVIYMTGWAPAAAQPKPMRPGSAAARLADALQSVEVSLGEKAKP